MNTNDQDYRDTGAIDAFEHRLARIPLGTAPPALRARVLARIEQVHSRQSPEAAEWELNPRKVSWFATLFRCVPMGASALAVLWLIVGVTHSADRWLNGDSTHVGVFVSTDQMIEARRERAEVRHLLGFYEISSPRSQGSEENDSGEPPPQPQSHRRQNEVEGKGRYGLSILKMV